MKFVGDKETREVHVEDCNLVKKIESKEEFGSIIEAHKEGYDNCTLCIGCSKKELRELEEKCAAQTSLWVSIGIVVASVIATLWAWDSGIRWLALIGAGAVGGLIHEILQDDGRMYHFPVRKADGIYLGSAFGVIAGAVAAVIMINAAENVQNISMSTAFLAGLSLKGVSEAAAGKEVPYKEARENGGDRKAEKPRR